MKGRLRYTSLEVKVAVQTIYRWSLLIYFGSLLVASRVRDR
jgi:hypothetical protein